MWFRSDLRVADNPALHHARKAADNGVIAVFAVCTKQWAEHDWGSMKVDFVLRNVRALSEALARLNIPLVLIRADRFAQVPGRLLTLAKRHACEALYLNSEYEVNELQRDREVTALFHEHGRSVHTFTDQVILDADRLRTGAGRWYTVFTPFKRKWCEIVKEEGLPPVGPRPRRQGRIGIEPDAVPATVRVFAGHQRPDLWPAGERAAQKRLNAFVARRIGDYHKARDHPAIDGTSALSPYLAVGVLSARQCLQAALDANHGRLDSGRKGVTTWISELIWREFYRYILVGFPRVCMGRPFKTETDNLPWRYDEGQFAAWCAGRTGFPIVDAGMRQLAQTGWMHNRLRMIVAMFLTKDLFIDWRWGERHFMQHLVDGDLASNNGGWQWSASTGTDAAPYFRVFNPLNQSWRYDPDGSFIRRFVPELAGLTANRVHCPDGQSLAALDYPRPIVDRRNTRQFVMRAFRRLPGRTSS
ncbi:MAG: deoxyribodipyrimidine photo-lyase [Phycisphaerales bacterium]|nr:MAG: deoxyribodipyrimidine photo-lyase [Phycisphaerales bacterium]